MKDKPTEIKTDLTFPQIESLRVRVSSERHPQGTLARLYPQTREGVVYVELRIPLGVVGAHTASEDLGYLDQEEFEQIVSENESGAVGKANSKPA